MWTSGEQFEDGIYAMWEPKADGHPNGLVLLNQDHTVVVKAIQAFTAMHPNGWYDDIAKVVAACYGESAVAKIAHSEQMKSLVGDDGVEEVMRNPLSLTMSLLGLIAEESMINERIRALGITKKRKTA